MVLGLFYKLLKFFLECCRFVKRLTSSPPTVTMSIGVASRWQQLQGSGNWKGLLDPLDLDLRKEIIRYGRFAQGSNDTFYAETRSRYGGGCQYSKADMFNGIGMLHTGYEITRYLYSLVEAEDIPGFIVKAVTKSSGHKESNWMGFVAVTTDPAEIKRLGRRDIVIAWRGTRRMLEWLAIVRVKLVDLTSNNEEDDEVQVAEGFWKLFTDSDPESVFNKESAAQQVSKEVRRLVNMYKGEPLSITVVGHSLGAALAAYTGYQLAAAKINEPSPGVIPTIPVTVFTWGAPRSGNDSFKRRFDALGVKCLRVRNIRDIVAEVPLGDDGKTPIDNLGYDHVGTELQVDYLMSPYLKQKASFDFYHNLEVYLHLTNGTNGKQAFKLAADEDLALINKAGDILEDKYSYNVPTAWWLLQNRGLVLNSEGKWTEPFRYDPDHDHPANAAYI